MPVEHYTPPTDAALQDWHDHPWAAMHVHMAPEDLVWLIRPLLQGQINAGDSVSRCPDCVQGHTEHGFKDCATCEGTGTIVTRAYDRIVGLESRVAALELSRRKLVHAFNAIKQEADPYLANAIGDLLRRFAPDLIPDNPEKETFYAG